jgi:hypothetical protein
MNDYGIGTEDLTGATTNFAHLLWIGDEQDVDVRKVGYELLLALAYFKTISQRWLRAWNAVTDNEHWQYKEFLDEKSADHVQFDLGKLNGIIGPNRLKALLKLHMVSARTISNQVVQDDATPIQKQFADSILEDLMISTDDDVTYIFARDRQMFEDDEVLGFILRQEAMFCAASYGDLQIDYFVLQGISQMHIRMGTRLNFLYHLSDSDKASAVALLKEGVDNPLHNIVETTLFDYTNPGAALSSQEVQANLPPDKFEMPHVEQFRKRDSRIRMMKLIYPNQPMVVKDATELEKEKEKIVNKDKKPSGSKNANNNASGNDEDDES